MVLAAIVLTGTISFCNGRSVGRDESTTIMHDSLRRVRAEQIVELGKHRIQDSIVLRAAEQAVADARAVTTVEHKKYVEARKLVKLVSDTSIQVQDVIFEVPYEVTLLINRADSTIAADSVTIRADSITIRAQAAVLEDVSGERDLWKLRALDDEKQIEELKAQKKGSRFGFKSGAVLTGVLVVIVKAIL